MWRSPKFLLFAVAMSGLLAAGCSGAIRSNEDPEPTPVRTLAPDETIVDGVIITPHAQRAISSFSTNGWDTDFTRHTVPYDEIFSGGPPKDGIPAINKPMFVSFVESDKWLDPKEPVAIAQHNGEAKAYPLQILIWHEIVNDVIGGEPVTITFCPLCNTTIAFRRTFEGQVLDFGTTGNLRFSDLVMYDRQTESWWQQATGESIIGTHAGKELEFFLSSVVSYEDFKASFTSGLVLSRDTGYDRAYGNNPYGGYDTDSGPFLFRGNVDSRLEPMERVVTIDLNGEAVAYPFAKLAEARAINDTVGGQPVVVLFKAGTKSALDKVSIADSRDVGSGVAFDPSVDGRVLTFKPDGERFVDEQTGSTWNIAGKATSGPLEGNQLDPIVHGNNFWFSWAVFKPETRLYGVS